MVFLADILLAGVARNYVNIDPRRSQILAYLGYAKIMDHKYSDATENLKRALKLNPQDEGSWYNLGIAHQRLGNIEEAMGAFSRAYELRPRSNEFRDALSTCKQALAARAASKGKFDEAVKLLQEDLAANENQPHGWFLLATFYQFGLKDRDHAKEALDHAIKLDPKNTHYQEWLDRLKKENPSKEEDP